MAYELDVERIRRRAVALGRLASSLDASGPVGLSLPGRARAVDAALADLVASEQRTTVATATAVHALADELRAVVDGTLAADRAGWGAR